MNSWGAPALVSIVGLAMLALMFLTLDAAEPDYADLVPVPDSIVWEKGDEITLWLSTNRHAVDLQVSSIALGIGEIDLRDPSSGQAIPLGEGLGCLDAVVSDLSVSNITGSTATVTLTLDPPAGSIVRVYWRRYAVSSGPPSLVSYTDLSLTPHTYSLSGLTSGREYRFDAATDEHFPSAIARSITFTAGDADSATSDSKEEEVHLLEDTGVTLVACDQHEDVAITLHGGGVELNRYLVNILPAAAVNAAPVFDAAYTTRRVCVDTSTTTKALLLSGDESVGAAVSGTDADGDTLTYTLLGQDSDAYFYFAIATSTGQISVNAAGANDTSGLGLEAVYPVVVKAEDGNGGAARVLVAVQLDTAEESPDGDGLCP